MKDEELVKTYSFTEYIKIFFCDLFVYHSPTKGIILSRKDIVTIALNTLWESSKDISIILRTVANKVLAKINTLDFDNINYPSPENF